MAASLQHGLTCAVLLLAVAVAVVPHACMASNNTNTTLLQDRCESYAGGDNRSYAYCVWTLQRDSRSATADSLGLAVIAARMARATAKATAAKIAALQKANETAARAPYGLLLAACAREYAAAVRRIGHAAASARSANVEHAQMLLAEAAGTPARCEAAFAAAGLPTPLAGSDLGLDDQIELAIAILPPPRRTTPPPVSSSQRGGGDVN